MNLLPKEPIESFWDAMWLGIQLFLCLISEKSTSKIKFATERTDRELLGRPVARYSAVFCFISEKNSSVFVFYLQQTNFLKLNLLPKEPIESFWGALWLGIRPCLCFDARMS